MKGWLDILNNLNIWVFFVFQVKGYSMSVLGEGLNINHEMRRRKAIIVYFKSGDKSKTYVYQSLYVFLTFLFCGRFYSL